MVARSCSSSPGVPTDERRSCSSRSSTILFCLRRMVRRCASVGCAVRTMSTFCEASAVRMSSGETPDLTILSKAAWKVGATLPRAASVSARRIDFHVRRLECASVRFAWCCARKKEGARVRSVGVSARRSKY